MLALKYFNRTDFGQLISWIDSPAFLLHWGGPKFDYPVDELQLEKYIKDSNNSNSENLIYKVVSVETGEVIGHISLGEIDRKNKSAKIAKVLIGNKDVRGKGIGQRMIKEILRVAFEELNLHRVNLVVLETNKSAIECYKKVGFVEEGRMRDARKKDDKYYSLIEMSILEDEYYASKT